MWWNVLLLAAGLATIAAAFLKFLDEAWVSNSKKDDLQTRFTNWWYAVEESDSRKLAVIVATKVSQTADFYLGTRLLSRRAFTRSFTIGSAFLALVLGLTGIRTGRPLGLSPWQSLREAAQAYNTNWENQQSARSLKPQTDSDKKVQQFEQQLKFAVDHYTTTKWQVIYSVASLLLLLILNGCFFFSSLVYSRLILREIIAAARVFSTMTLLLANFAFTLPTWALFFALEIIVFTPWLWLALPAVYILSKVSIYWLLLFLAGGGIGGLAFGSPGLKLTSLVGFTPCFLALLITLISGVILQKRKLFHRLASCILFQFATKGPLKFTVAFLALMAVALGALVTVLRYWK